MNASLAGKAARLSRSMLAMAALASLGAARIDQPPTDPRPFPSPPLQGQPWTPPETRLPKFFVSATAALFDQGVADPRGCEYRAIELAVGSAWNGGGAAVKTRGWVLPASKDDPRRFAVAWNGLVYPVVTVGDAVDLATDVVAMVRASVAARDVGGASPVRGARFFGGRYLGYNAFPEAQAVSAENLMPLRVALLLRSGRIDLAEQAWTAGTGREPVGRGLDLTDYGVSYLSIGSDWVWGLFDRTVGAHMRGDDRLALEGVRLLDRGSRAIEAKAQAMGFERAEGRTDRYFDFLGQLPELLADQERRGAEPRREPRPKPGVDRPRRIAALIRDLDQVAARQSGQPGGIGLGEDVIVQELIREGEDAVEPLLTALENDTRLTRSVSFHRDFFRGRMIHGVHEAVFIALGGILRTSAFGLDASSEIRSNGMDGRRRLARAIRVYWEKNRNVSIVERWYRTLGDDRATPSEWLQAAGNIVQPADYETTFGSVWVRVPQRRKPGEIVPLKGDALRDKAGPSVADLMARRVVELSRKVREAATDPIYSDQAVGLALILATWDKVAARPVLRDQFGRTRRAAEGESQASSIAWNVVRITLARHRDGDPEALNDYAEWLRKVTPETVQDRIPEIFEPMWKNPRHPAIVETARRLFGDPGSPWVPLVGDRSRPALSRQKGNLATSGLVGVAPFRERLLVELKDRTEIGTAKATEQGVGYAIDGGQSGGSGPSYLEPDGSEAKGEARFRVCDYLAWLLSQRIDGVPACLPYWSLPRRDAAVAACAAFLERYGERLADSTGHDDFQTDPFRSRWQLSFPTLDRPATREDVQQGLAIFSMEGEGQARLAPIPARPLKATWTTLKDHAYKQQFFDPRGGKSGTRIAYDQDGLVWQAEEVLKDDRWERSYGFAGRRLARVPASEIEFPEDRYRWGTLSGPIDCRLALPDGQAPVQDLGKPMVVTLQLRNRSGVDRAIPTDLYHREGPALRRGLDLKLSYTAEDPSRFGGMRMAGPPPKWEDLTPRIAARFVPDDSSRTLGPAEAFEAARIDLGEWFAVDRPGLYRLRIAFGEDSGISSGASNELTLPVTVGTPAR